ncbi:MAG: hypothetical protein K9W44_16050 [Candidatus Lokiarchaeota archaeon]|nr:hypothetical protein [Candidatus Harpocratesius repetitus]
MVIHKISGLFVIVIYARSHYTKPSCVLGTVKCTRVYITLFIFSAG